MQSDKHKNADRHHKSARGLQSTATTEAGAGARAVEATEETLVSLPVFSKLLNTPTLMTHCLHKQCLRCVSDIK